MCALFEIDLRSKDIEKILQKKIESSFMEHFRQVAPSQTSFVLLPKKEENTLDLSEMSYGLVPSWASDKKIKFATHNARIESLNEKATWKGPLKAQRCVVPLTGFIEPIYSGPFEGHMVKFEKKDKELMFAGGLWDQWMDKLTGEIFLSFAIVTRPPYKMIEDNGHDRSPVLLDLGSIDQWLDQKNQDPRDLLTLLQAQKSDHYFCATVERPLKNFDKNQLKLF